MDVVSVPAVLVGLLGDAVKRLHASAVEGVPGVDPIKSLAEVDTELYRARHYPDTHLLYVAVDDEELIGYALVTAQPLRDVLGAAATFDHAVKHAWTSENVFVTWLAVEPTHRRCGVATSLVQAAATSGPVHALVADANTVSQCFWRRLGAQSLGRFGECLVMGGELGRRERGGDTMTA